MASTAATSYDTSDSSATLSSEFGVMPEENAAGEVSRERPTQARETTAGAHPQGPDPGRTSIPMEEPRRYSKGADPEISERRCPAADRTTETRIDSSDVIEVVLESPRGRALSPHKMDESGHLSSTHVSTSRSLEQVINRGDDDENDDEDDDAVEDYYDEYQRLQAESHDFLSCSCGWCHKRYLKEKSSEGLPSTTGKKTHKPVPTRERLKEYILSLSWKPSSRSWEKGAITPQQGRAVGPKPVFSRAFTSFDPFQVPSAMSLKLRPQNLK